MTHLHHHVEFFICSVPSFSYPNDTGCFQESLYVKPIEMDVLIHLKLIQGFLYGSVVKSLPANAGDMGLIPGPGRTHMLWSN